MVDLVPGGGLATASDEIVRRLKLLVPNGWFSNDSAPTRDAVFGGVGDALSGTTDLLAYTYDQSRIATAHGWWLDLIAWDYFGSRFLRRRGEGDQSFRPRILQEILRPRATRAAISRALVDLTGNAPTFIELWNPGDCGAYDTGFLAYAGEPSGTADLSGYDTNEAVYDFGSFAYVTPAAVIPGSPGVGCWGSYDYDDQILVTAYRTVKAGPAASGFYDTPSLGYGGGDPAPSFFGYDTAQAAYDIGTVGYLMPSPPYGVFAGAGYWTLEQTASGLSDADLYAAIAAVTASGVIAWTRIKTVVAAG